MKKILTIVIGLFGICNLSFSQFEIGVHTGFDVSTVSIGGVPDVISDQTSFRTSARFGVNGQLNLSPQSAIKTELNYLTKGLKVDQHIVNIGNAIPLSATLDASLNYVEIPVMYKHTFPMKNIALFVEGGPSMLYGLNGSISPEVSLGFDFRLPSYEVDFADETFNRMSYNMNIGGGIKMPMDDQLSLVANIRYSQGINDLITVPIVDVETKSNVVNVGIGVSYRL